MNTRKIYPRASWSPEGGDITIDTLCLKDFFHYFFDGEGGKVSYTLSNSQTGLDYFSGNINVPASVVQEWGASDDIIFEFVAIALNLIIIE
jgi:hypothetical protein